MKFWVLVYLGINKFQLRRKYVKKKIGEFYISVSKHLFIHCLKFIHSANKSKLKGKKKKSSYDTENSISFTMIKNYTLELDLKNCSSKFLIFAVV